MTWVGQVLLQVDHRVAEPGARFGAGLLGGFDQVFFLVHHAHAATTTATGGLDDHRVTDFATNAQGGCLVFRQWAVGAWNGWHAGCDHGVLGRHLVAHQADGFGFRADEGEAGFFHLFGEIGVFREEAVAWVDAISAGHFSGRDDVRDFQVRVRGQWRADADAFVRQFHVHQFGIGRRVNSDGLDALFLTGAQDTQRDLAAVGDQDFLQFLRRFQHRRRSAVQTMVNSGWSYSTG